MKFSYSCSLLWKCDLKYQECNKVLNGEIICFVVTLKGHSFLENKNNTLIKTSNFFKCIVIKMHSRILYEKYCIYILIKCHENVFL